MDDSQPVPFPEFETLPPIAQERLGGLARGYGLSKQKTLMLTMLIAQGLPLKDLIVSCRMMELPLTLTDLTEIRAKMNEWVGEEQHRQMILARLEEKGALTEGRRECLMAARTRQERMAVYFEAIPFEPLEGGKGDDGLFSEVTWFSIIGGAMGGGGPGHLR